MTKREITAIVLKLLGVYAILQAIPMLQYLWGLLGMMTQDKTAISQKIWFFLPMGIPFLFMAVAAFLLLTRSERMAGAIIREDGPVSPSTPLSGQEVQAIAFSVVGVLVFLLAVPKLCQIVINLWYVKSQYARGMPTDQLVERAWQSGIGLVIQCGLAVILFLRARGLAHLWHRIQGPRPAQTDGGGSDQGMIG